MTVETKSIELVADSGLYAVVRVSGSPQNYCWMRQRGTVWMWELMSEAPDAGGTLLCSYVRRSRRRNNVVDDEILLDFSASPAAAEASPSPRPASRRRPAPRVIRDASAFPRTRTRTQGRTIKA